MEAEKFRIMARKRLLRKFRTFAIAANQLGITPKVLSHGLTGARKMPQEILDYFGYESHKETTVTYTKRKGEFCDY